MAMSESAGGKLTTAARAAVRVEASRLSQRYAIDRDRVEDCLKKLVVGLGQGSTGDARGLAFAIRAGSLSFIDDALHELGPQDALALFEQEDIGVLARRVWATEYLAREQVPLYSLAELANHTESFITYLETDRDHLIRTGLPRKSFGACPWL